MTRVAERYGELLASGELRDDPEQAATVARLDALAAQLEAAEGQSKRGLIARLFLALRRAGAPRMYLWGGVGRGKSMLMDLFFDSVAVTSKRRVHFHAFMIEVHERLKIEREAEKGTRSCRWSRPSPPRRGCCASTRWSSTTWPTPRSCRGCSAG
jgi:cell division protein ZapE